MSRASIHAVALEAQVSAATVSRVFNTPQSVSPDTRARVEAVARRLQYRPLGAGRTLRRQRSEVLGVVLPTLRNPVFAECLEGIAAAAADAGHAIQLRTTEYRPAQEHAAVSALLPRVDGLVLVVSNPARSRALQAIRAAGLPYVLAYNRHASHPCVAVDNEGAVAELVDALLARGHRRIAMLCGDLKASDRSRARQQGFQRGLLAAGLPPGPVVEVPFDGDAGTPLAALFARPDRPSALVCSNDLLALRALRAAHACGLRVPQDLSIAGFDGIALGQELVPSLATIAQPNREIGATCVALLAPAAAAGTPLDASASRLLPHAWRPGESLGPPSPDTTP
ncbi:substrate-binding domain-containing protein [Xylophilus rhododendri]|uniref:Substrate-binding domain-containing protein n=1 Tax=Xylophilus rhododendri TaxID=2697032 RepID=A0A857JAF6_9BURK|nr:LacI family DNA-binding transcriptional regulator [Xylophilus rhododendri]QHI99718.1 substrate-binding domain-containing protein [Xylophilus rhododendri]